MLENLNIKQVYLFDDIAPSSYGNIIRPLLEEKNKYDTIILYMNSYGGDTESGYSIMESLKFLKKNI